MYFRTHRFEIKQASLLEQNKFYKSFSKEASALVWRYYFKTHTSSSRHCGIAIYKAEYGMRPSSFWPSLLLTHPRGPQTMAHGLVSLRATWKGFRPVPALAAASLRKSSPAQADQSISLLLLFKYININEQVKNPLHRCQVFPHCGRPVTVSAANSWSQGCMSADTLKWSSVHSFLHNWGETEGLQRYGRRKNNNTHRPRLSAYQSFHNYFSGLNFQGKVGLRSNIWFPPFLSFPPQIKQSSF